MGKFAKKINTNAINNTNAADPRLADMKKRIGLLVDMQVSGLQGKIEILTRCKQNANKANTMLELMNIYQNLVEMVASDNKVFQPSAVPSVQEATPVQTTTTPAAQVNFNV